MALLLISSPVWAADVIMNSLGSSSLFATAFDQPELNAVLVDPTTGSVILDSSTGEEAIFEAFIDTGASSFVISKITAEGDPANLVLGLGLYPPGDNSRDWDETGIGGVETGWVSDPYKLRIANGSPGAAYSDALYSLYEGEHGLWVRKDEGLGESFYTVVDPVNVIGMPVIRQRLMVMDPSDVIEILTTPIEQVTGTGRMQTDLVKSDDQTYVFPQTNITFEMYLQSFPPVPSPPDDPDLSYSENPMLSNVTITDATGSVTKDWLFDTGAGSSFISFERAKDTGLIPSQYADVDAFLAANPGTATTVVAGIGADTTTVPILNLDEIRIPDKYGDFDVVWQNVDVLVLDVAGLDGVFGMNLLMPSATLDFTELDVGLDLFDLLFNADLLTDEEFLELLAGLGPGYWAGVLEALANPSFVECEAMIFDATDPNNVEFRMYSNVVPEPTSVVLLACAVLALAARRRWPAE